MSPRKYFVITNNKNECLESEFGNYEMFFRSEEMAQIELNRRKQHLSLEFKVKRVIVDMERD